MAWDEEKYNKLFDNVSAMLFVQDANPVLHKDELYITFTAKDDEKFEYLRSAIYNEVKLVFGETDKRIVRIRRCQDRCEINFIH